MKELLDNLWVEKYRPEKLEDIVISKDLKKKMLSYKEDGSIPHIIFVGTAGIGKTSLARILTRDILDCEFISINASDEGGVDTMRSKVKTFATSASFDNKIKIVILGEADGLSSSAQDSLKEIIEDCSETTRFIFTVNNISKMSEPIVSRCQRFDLKCEPTSFTMRLKYIANEENVEISNEDLVNLTKRYYPDFRSAINNLQKYTVDGVFKFKEEDDFSFVKNLWVKIVKEEPEDVRKYYIENSIAYEDEESLLLSLAKYAFKNFKPENSRKILLLINKYLVQSSILADKELNLYCWVLEVKGLFKKD